MINFENRKNEYCNSVSCVGSFCSILESMDRTLKGWVIQDLHELTKTAMWTIEYSWGSGRSEPDNLKKSIISEYFGIPEDTLFPKA